MASVPALAFAGNWQVAGLLILLERAGKAIRNPPRDVMGFRMGLWSSRGARSGWSIIRAPARCIHPGPAARLSTGVRNTFRPCHLQRGFAFNRTVPLSAP